MNVLFCFVKLLDNIIYTYIGNCIVLRTVKHVDYECSIDSKYSVESWTLTVKFQTISNFNGH